MFWRVPSYSQASPLEGILDKQKFTLEELLDEEDLIQVWQSKISQQAATSLHACITQNASPGTPSSGASPILFSTAHRERAVCE